MNKVKRRRHPADVRRSMIVDASRSLITEVGIVGATMRGIADRAEISLGTLTYHFSGVDELLVEIIRVESDEILKPLMREVAAKETGADALDVVISTLLASSPRIREHWVLWLNFWTSGLQRSDHADVQRASYRRWRRSIKAIMERGREDGSILTDDPEADAYLFVAQLDGLVVQTFMPPKLLSAKSARELLHRSIRHLIV